MAGVVKFHEQLSSENRVVFMRREGQVGMTNVDVAFHNFAIPSKNSKFELGGH